MNWLKAITREVVGLFIDDGNFALAIGGWLGFSFPVLPHFEGSAGWRCATLFCGLAVILVESTIRQARHGRRP